MGKNLVDLAEPDRIPALDTVQATVLEQPHKTPLLAGSIQVANSINSSIGKITLESFHMRFQNAVNLNDWALVKALTRFVVCLYPIISEGEASTQNESEEPNDEFSQPPAVSDPSQSGAVKLLHTLLDRAIVMQAFKGTERSPLAEEFYATAVLAIPYLCSSIILNVASNETKSAILSLIEKSREFIALQKKTESVVQASALYPFINGDNAKNDDSQKAPYTPQIYIDAIAEAVDRFEESNFETRSFVDLARLVELHVSKDPPAVRHAFPTVHFPDAETLASAPYYGSYAGPGPRLFLTAYLPSRDLETVPAPNTIEAVAFRDVIQEVITYMDFNPNEVAHQLLTFDWYASKTAFATPGIPIEKLLALQESTPAASTWKSEDLCMDAVLDLLMKLPGNYTDYDKIIDNDNVFQNADGSFSILRRNSPLSLRNVYFHTIIMKMCRFSSAAMAPVVGRAIRFLYDHVGSLDVELQQRIIDWFSHHLSNFQFTWTWYEWMYYIHLPDLHPKKVFIQQLILKEIRLCNVERVRMTLPPDVARRCLPEISQEPTSKWFLTSSPFHEEILRFRELLASGGASAAEDSAGANSDAIDAMLQELREKAASVSDGTDPTSAFVDMVVSTICQLGSRSLTHVELMIVQFKDMLVDVCSLDPTAAIESILEYWVEQVHVSLLVVLTFIKKGVISPKSFTQIFFDYKRGTEEEYNVDENEDSEDLKLQGEIQAVAARAEARARQATIEGTVPVAEETDEDREVRDKALSLTKRKNRRHLWPHWRLLATSHGWESLIQVLQFAQSPTESELAQSERDELLIDLVAQFSSLISDIDEDAREAQKIADEQASAQHAADKSASESLNKDDFESAHAADEDENAAIEDYDEGRRRGSQDYDRDSRRRRGSSQDYAYRDRYSEDRYQSGDEYEDRGYREESRHHHADSFGEGGNGGPAPEKADSYYTSQWEENGAPYKHIKTEQLARTKESRDAESKRWALWWTSGVTKALIRRYREWFSREEVAQGIAAAVGPASKAEKVGAVAVLEYLKEVGAL